MKAFRWLVWVLGAGVLASCASLGDQVVVAETHSAFTEDLGDLERDLWRAEAQQPSGLNTEFWRLWLGRLASARRPEVIDRRYRTRWAALAGAGALLRGRSDEAQDFFSQAQDAPAFEETREWLKLRLEQPQAPTRLAALETRYRAGEGPWTGRLGLEYGELLSQAQRWGEASAALEQALESWPEGEGGRWALLLSEARLRRRDTALSQEESRWLAQTELRWEGFLGLAALRTRLLDEFSQDSPGAAVLLNRLAETGWIEGGASEPAESRIPGLGAPPRPRPEQLVSRRAAAWWLGQALRQLENRPDLGADAAVRFRTRSPLPDVDVQDPALGFIVAVLERQLMDLPDGRRFQGAGVLTGREWLGILQNLVRRYPRAGVSSNR